MGLKKYNESFEIVLLVTSALMLDGCNSVLLNPKGQIGIEQRSLIITSFSLMLIVVVPAIIMAIVFAWKYHSSNVDSKYSPNWSHSNKVEVIIWTIPILIILFLGTLTWKSTHALEPSKPIVSDIKPIEIDVIALDWKWLFIYPDYGVATVNEIAFPINTPITFKVTSNSVMNSFFIPALGSQIYAMAGMQTKLHLISKETGTFNGISSNFSGRGFSGMKFKVIATPDEVAFKKWIMKIKKTPNSLDTMYEFEKLAEQNENHPVTYFSKVNPDLFRQIIEKFMTSYRSCS